MSVAEIGLGFLSGLLSTLSPCVLPLIPIVLTTAVVAHRWGGLALGLGLTLSFTLLGLFIATIGVAIGLDSAIFKLIAGVMLIVFGVVLLIPTLHERFTQAASQLTGRGGGWVGKLNGEGLRGQFVVGLVLGMVWTPCVGPTLGAAVTLASAGNDLLRAASIMLAFGLGAALPLVLLGSLSRTSFTRLRSRILNVASSGKQVLGGLLLLLGLGIVSGGDRSLERWLVSVSPSWLTELTTRY